MLKLLNALAFSAALLLGFASPSSPSLAQDIAQAEDEMMDAEGMMDEAPADDGAMEEPPAEDDMMGESPADGDDMEDAEMGDPGA